MNKKVMIIWICMLIMLVIPVSAVLTDNIRFGWNYDNNNLDDIVSGQKNWTDSGTSNITGLINDGRDFTAATPDSLTLSGLIEPYFDQDWTFCTWMKPDAIPLTTFFDERDAGGNNGQIIRYRTGIVNSYGEAGGGNTDGTTSPLIGSWYLFCAQHHEEGAGDFNNVWINDTLEGNSSYNAGDAGAVTAFLGKRKDSAEGYDGVMDETYFWNETLSQIDMTALYTNGLAGLSYPWGAIVGTFDLTASDNATGVSLTIFNATITNSTGNTRFFSTTNGTINTNVSDIAGLINITVQSETYSNGTTIGVNSSLTFDQKMTKFWYLDITFPQNIGELQTQSIILIVNKTIEVNNTAAILYWNNTQQTVTKKTFATFDLFNATFETPTFSIAYNTTFIWNVTINTTETLNIDNITGFQNVTAIEIDNCSTFTTVGINMTVRNITTDAKIPSSMSGFFSAFFTGGGLTKNFNLTWDDGTNFGICINGETQAYNLTGQIQYSANGETTQYTYFFNNASINNNTQLLDLYIQDGTTQVVFEVVDQNDNPLEGVFVHMLRFDLPTNTFRTVQIMQTGSDGKTIGNAVLNTQQYKFLIFGADNQLLFESSPIILTVATQKFTINLQPNFLDLIVTSQGTVCRTEFNNATKLYSFFWSDPSGAVNNGELQVRRLNPSGNVFIGSANLATSSGQVTVNISTDLGNNSFTYTGQGTISVSGSSFTCGNVLEVDFNQRFKTFGLDGVLVTMLLVVGMAMIGIWHPIAAVLLTTVTIGFAIIFGIFNLSFGVMMAFFIIAGMVIFRVSQR